ncbi:MAG: DNA gyrase subunit A [Acidobacteriota bacterium]|nr:DNA gyrase subunit A [Acidobacteriota bacterium]MDE3043633.1 DNA gyrase subunit A [Acidobacteriota bacterium]MDE3107399.1 DNA gyrase subunit A [Acidobacteriota bacterium]
MARKSSSSNDSPPPNEEDLGYVEPIEINLEMERSFLEYSMSVIVSRALPDVRDGLKPVHRRILYSMFDQGLRPDRPHTKCAKVVGEVMGTYHPHGDSAIYDALVRMVQDFSMRHPLISGHGNFGGTGPDEGAAAMRYTECRLAPLALEMLDSIDEDTVDFEPNYDNSTQQPTVLPSRYPNLLVNGSQGIAVGMATKIPPHNLGEVIDATLHLLANPEATPDDLMKFVKGPDFPTGAQILGRQGILDAYRTGRGSIKTRAVAEIEETNRDVRIVVTEFPYEVSVEAIEEKIHDLVKAGELDGITAVQNDSSGRQPRLVIRLKRDANANVVLNKLYKNTTLQTTFAVNMLALVDGVPRTLNLAQALTHYIAHQVEVVTRRTQFRLRKAEARAHIVEGLLKAIDMLDQVIATIRGSDDRAAARASLMATPFSFSEEQANHILDMTLGRLTRLGRRELDEEMAKLRETIAELQSILASDVKLRGVIAEEITAIRDKYAEARVTQIVNDPGELGVEDLIEDEEIVITMTQAGYVKSVAADAFRTQGRGGRGVQGAKLKEEDLVEQILHTSSLAHLLMFSNRGRVFRLRGHEIPMKDRTAKGTAVVNLLNLQPGESVQAIIATDDFPADKFLVFATKNGTVKKTALSEYDKSRREGWIAINLRDGDEVVRVVPTSGHDDLMVVTFRGMSIRFNEAEVREMGRDATGVRAIRLKDDDRAISLDVVREDADLFVVTDTGFGKRVKTERFNRQGRGGQGVRAIKLTAARGFVVAAFMVRLDDEVLLASTGGVLIRTPVREVSSQGRDATGVRVMNLDEGHQVATAAVVPSD